MDAKIFEELKQLSTAFAELEKKYKKAKADMPMQPQNPDDDSDGPDMEDMMDNMKEMMSNMNQNMWDAMSNVHSRIDRLGNAISEYVYSHAQNHAPHLKTASQMENYLKMVGASNDYTIAKPVIQCNASTRTVDVELKFKK